jgi:3-hydroxymyristoyl/3-hydroxydecanoyl-(acyl carrier protein) dehydratase
MPHHFRAFSFVDRITSVQPGVSVTGTYTVPATLTDFSGSLVAEATGQLAAWSAMAAVDFKSRPVAGIAGLVEMLAPIRPGDTLELSAEIESVDVDAISYGGTASVNGSPVLRLHDCVGPMLPLEDFDDPQSLRERYALLCGGGVTSGAFGGVPSLSLEMLVIEPGKFARARLQVPTDAPFFGDHFPRKPVFPGSLLMQFNLQLVGKLAAQLPHSGAVSSRWKLKSISYMKLRTFIPPGESLDLEVKVLSSNETTAEISVESKRGSRLVGAARVTLSLEK